MSGPTHRLRDARRSVSVERAIADAALEVACERAAVLDRLRRALLQRDERESLRLARILTGIEEEHGTSDRPRSG